MQPYQGKWSDLQVGTYMRDQNGKVWKVIAERDFHLQIQDREGTKKHLTPRSPSTPVTLMGASEGEAEATLRDVLRAKAIARRANGETDWLVPPFPTPGQPGAVQEGRAHMIMAHGVWCDDVKTTAGLIEAHVASHQRPDKGYQEHTHPGGNPS